MAARENRTRIVREVLSFAHFARPLVQSVLVLALSVVPLVSLTEAHAQYDKQDWPAQQALPALVGTDQHGKVWDLKALRGRPVVINFWATWCGPCTEELPSLQSLAGGARGQVAGPVSGSASASASARSGQAPIVLAVNVKEPAPRVLQFVQTQGLSLPVLMDPKGEITRRFGVSIYPTTVLVSASGKPRWRVLGSLDWTDAEPGRWISQLHDAVHR